MPLNTLNTPKILTAAIAKAQSLLPEMRGDHLDIGSGQGDLIELLRQNSSRAGFNSRACDYTTELMKLRDVPVDVVDLNTQPLPYPDAAFDLVTCTEVIEHIEHYRETLREIHRVLRPGGVLVVTTPNILNLTSRVRFLLFGFHNLFGPLHVKESRVHSTGGHINPVSFFYLSHSLLDAGFRDVSLSVDKWQRGSMVLAVLLFPLIALYSFFSIRKERDKYGTIDGANIAIVRALNRFEILLGRTLVVGCRK